MSVDDTRVILSDVDPSTPGSDYINANHIVVSGICTIYRHLPPIITTQLSRLAAYAAMHNLHT